MTRLQLNALMRAPDISYKLKAAIEQAQQRDPLDALRDAELLTEACRVLCQEAGIFLQ